MNFAAIIEKIKISLKKFSGEKGAESTPTAKGGKIAKLVKAPVPKNDEQKIHSATKSVPKKERKQKTSTGNKPKTKR